MKYLIYFLMLTFCISSCETKPGSDSQWISIFDGVSTDGWRGYNSDEMPPGWTVKDGMLMFDTELELEQNYKGGRDIIYGNQEFENFELYVEWKIPVGGNSGIFYHIKEGYGSPSEISPEYQLIDDVNYAQIHDLKSYNEQFGSLEPSKLQDWQQTAADYAMHTADTLLKKLNPAGKWNSTKIVFTKEKVEHWLNGEKVLSFVPWSEEWYEKRDLGKWKRAADYGKFSSGFIGFQDHGSSLWFKNIKIRKL